MNARIILGSVAIVGVIGIGVFVWRTHRSPTHAQADQERTVPVTVAMAEVRDVAVTVEGLGTVTPLASVTVRPQVDGRLDSALFKEGQTVKKGDLLAQIDPRPFTIQLHTAEAALTKDSAQERNAKGTLARLDALQKEGLASQQQVDDQRAAADQASATIRTDLALVESARLNLDYARITAPVDGVTGIRLVDPGNIIHAADPGGLVIVTQLDPIALVFTLPEDELPRVTAAHARGAHVTATSRDGSTVLGEGTLSVIDNQINTQTATVKLKAVLPNGEHKLWPNQFVKARLLLDTRRGALVVPAVAVQRGPKSQFVYVVDAQDRAQTRDVTAEEVAGDVSIVTRGLSAGDRVVVDGQGQLKPGAKVTVHK